MMIEILKPEEVAELLRISPNRVLLMARRGEIPFVMIGGRIRFDAAEIETWLNFHRNGASTVKPPRLVNP